MRPLFLAVSVSVAVFLATGVHAERVGSADRPGCNDTSRKGGLDLFFKFSSAYRCLGTSIFELGCVNWRLQRWGYGCYTSERNMGLDVQPVDSVDECGRTHDLDWHAICQHHSELDRDANDPTTTGCDCYLHTPKLRCNASTNPATLEIPENTGESSICERKCGEELRKQATCFAEHLNGHTPPVKYRTPWTWTTGPACIPKYCLSRTLGDPRNFVSTFDGAIDIPREYDRPDIPECDEPSDPNDPPNRP